MQLKDSAGYLTSGATPGALELYETANRDLRCYLRDPIGTADAAIAQSPRFLMAHVFKAWLYLLSTEPAATAAARGILDAARELPGNERERMHFEAASALSEGRWREASRRLEDLSIEYPRDGLALQVGHQVDFFRGDARMLRDRIARALPAWTRSQAGFHALLGMHAFGLEECGEYGAAESQGRRALEIEPRDSWAQHAVAHVMEMQSRQADGIAWMRANPEAWSHESFFAVHNWWHLALFHLDRGEHAEALALYDGPIRGNRSALAMEMIDASAMLWRMQLRGIEAGKRWQALADDWQAAKHEGGYAFNDVHAMMAYVGAGRDEAAHAVIEAQRAAMRSPGDNAAFTREVGHPAALAIQAFGAGDYLRCIELLRNVRGITHRFGGSHAQRDVFDLTLIEAALRGRQNGLAAALSAERLSAKPTNPYSRVLLQRASGLAMAA